MRFLQTKKFIFSAITFCTLVILISGSFANGSTRSKQFINPTYKGKPVNVCVNDVWVKCYEPKKAAEAFCVKNGFDKGTPNFSTASIKRKATTVIGINGYKDLGRAKGWQDIFTKITCKAQNGNNLLACLNDCKVDYPAGKERRLCKKECKINN